ncbi:hypothetical protein A6X20_41460 [Bradyrhizobium elkanii]|nr:hypothetical protein A6X20_41460 [Bradyrhizobium elkanii]ODM85909.1 hypothetical protein A6452_00010 [Bradyrhizobium elkanii]
MLGGDHQTRFAMACKSWSGSWSGTWIGSWISLLGAPLVAFVLTVAPLASPVHAVEDARKVSVVSFGLFGDQRV